MNRPCLHVSSANELHIHKERLKGRPPRFDQHWKLAAAGATALKGLAGKKKGTTLPLTTFLKPEMSNWADDDPESETGKRPSGCWMVDSRSPTAVNLLTQAANSLHLPSFYARGFFCTGVVEIRFFRCSPSFANSARRNKLCTRPRRQAESTRPS